MRHVPERSASPGTTFTVTSGLGAKWHMLALRRRRRLKCASISTQIAMAPLGRRALVSYAYPLLTIYLVMRDCANIYVVYSDAICYLKMRHKALVLVVVCRHAGSQHRYRKVAPLKNATACIKVAYYV